MITLYKIQKQMLYKKKNKKTKQNKTKNKKRENKNQLLTYVFTTVAILTIKTTVKNHIKFKICQHIG